MKTLGILILAAQVASIAYARCVPEKWFCWAPYDEHVQFQLEVRIDGERLSEEQLRARYRLPALTERRAFANIVDKLVQAESTYYDGEEAEITLRYRINGRAEEVWTWPRS
jgi:hypothetical protein